MHAVLGIDAAWTVTAPSGVALLVGEPGAWRCARIAPSLGAFVRGDGAAAIERPSRGADGARMVDLLATACELAGTALVSVLAVDMPLSRTSISGRRVADSCVSRQYGARGCAVHSPTSTRPGALSFRFRDDAQACGLPLITAGPVRVPAMIEVYPHVTLLDLLAASYRVPYKVARARRYWPERSSAERKDALLGAWREIEAALEARVGSLPDRVELSADASWASMKACEDALDGLVCAWTAALFLEGRAVALGDDDAAIWVPARVAA